MGIFPKPLLLALESKQSRVKAHELHEAVLSPSVTLLCYSRDLTLGL